MKIKEWAGNSLLVRMVKPFVAAYGASGMNRALTGFGKLFQNSGLYRNMARVAAKGFYTETSLFYRITGAWHRRRDKKVDALHNALQKPVLHSGTYRISTGLYRAASQNGYAVLGAVFGGFGLGFGVVSLILGAGEDIGLRLGIAGGCLVLGAALYAMRGYLKAHAGKSLIAKLFMYLLASEEETAQDKS